MGAKQDINLKEYREKLRSGTLAESEKEQLRSFVKSTYKNKELDELMAQHWEETDSAAVEPNNLYFRQLRDQIWSKITFAKQENNRINKPQIGWQTYLARIAAVLFIPLLITSMYLFYKLNQQPVEATRMAMQQVFATPGSRVHFTLPDQSEVWLNSGSTLEYPINLNSQSERKVKLTGQGYFKVSHDKTHPFYVETGQLNIKVLGTSFDISSYSNDQLMSSTLEEGSIALLDLNGKEVALMKPGQKAMLDKMSQKLLIENVDTRLTTSWKDGRLIFKNTPLIEVSRQLERWYNCDIQVAPGLLNAGILYTATIQNETLGEVLEMIEISTSVKTQVNGRKVLIME